MIINVEHVLGNYCKSVALSDVLRFHGYQLSESMVFGLSSAFDFSYSKPLEFGKGKKMFGFSGNSLNDYYNIAELLGINYISIKQKDKRLHFEIIREFLQKDIPIIASVSLMDYYSCLNEGAVRDEEFNQETYSLFDMLDTSVGNHVTTIVGLDEEEKNFFLYENTLNNLQKVGVEALLYASDPKSFSVIHPRNEIHIFIPTQDKMINLDYKIKEAINKNFFRFLFNSSDYSGVNALLKFSEEFQKWPNILKEEEHIKNSIQMFHYFCETASGGGFYRKLYSRFLREASAKVDDRRLIEFSKRYMKVARSWTSFSKAINSINNIKMAFKDDKNITQLKNVIDEEVSIARDLYEYTV
jgi:hypothetical protein